MYPPAPPAAPPSKRNASDTEDEELPEPPKKRKLVRAALVEKSSPPTNAKVQGAQQPQKRDRNIQETALTDSSGNKRQKVTVDEQKRGPATSSTATAAALPSTRTITAPRLDRVPGAQAFYGKHGLPKPAVCKTDIPLPESWLTDLSRL